MVDQSLTWNTLVELEPRLPQLYHRAKAIKDHRRTKSFCANQVWYGTAYSGSLKDRLCVLVGWERLGSGDPRLKTSEAYDLAYDKLYDVLPACRNCACG
jgi:hypothetical protein